MSAPNEYNESRIEQQLSYLMNGSGVLPAPVSRIEQQIDYIVNNGTATEQEIRGEVTEIKSDVSAMKSIGRYLSVWDCTTGLPQTDPTTIPYTYQTGDYYRIGVVAAEGGTNYKPSGTTYTGAASTDVESGDPALGDIYVYDGTSWGLLKGAVLLDAAPTQGSTNAVTSGGVWNAIAQKQDTISDLATIRSGAMAGSTALQSVPPTYRTAAAQDTIDNGQNTVINGKEAKGKITIGGVEKTANAHTVTIVTNGVMTNLTLVGVA